MNLIHAILLGIIEGLTEFLPISSTFHLLAATKILGIPNTDFSTFFAVFIQAFAIVPVIFLFGREWLNDKQILLKVLVSFIPTAVVGLVLNKVIKEVFFASPWLMLASFFTVGLLFLGVELLIKKEKFQLKHSIADMSWIQAFMIGVIQAFAVVPGVSRAGAVIVGMMLFGFKRDEAAKYSFTLAVPTILAAAGLDLIKSRSVLTGGAMSQNLLLLSAGSITAFISSFIIVNWFIKYLKTHSLNIFGGYRIVMAGVLLALGFTR